MDIKISVSPLKFGQTAPLPDIDRHENIFKIFWASPKVLKKAAVKGYGCGGKENSFTTMSQNFRYLRDQKIDESFLIVLFQRRGLWTMFESRDLMPKPFAA